METIALISGSIALTVALVGFAWLLRCDGCLTMRSGSFAILTIIFTLWHYSISNGEAEIIITNIFVMIAVYINCTAHIDYAKVVLAKNPKAFIEFLSRHGIDRRKGK